MSDHAATDSKSYLTTFNVIAGIIVIFGLIATIMRFTGGLGAVTNLSDYNPWGIWIGFDLLCGVALAAGGYVTSAACYIFGMKRFHSAVRPAILTGFLGYSLVFLALLYDVGRPFRLVLAYPFVVQQGTSSLLFEVGLCVALYLNVLFLEFCPAALEWLGIRKLRDILVKITMVLTIFGVVLSTLHQSSLGALYLIAPAKLHPLWYSQYIPVYFFVSSVIAGLSMVLFESTLAHKYFHHKMDETHLGESDGLTMGFGKAAAIVLAGYFTIKVIGIAADNNWHHLATGWGAWYLVELIGFIALPCFLFAMGVRDGNLKLIRYTAAWTVLGIIVNRLNVSVIAFNYHLPAADRYFPHFWEIVTSVFIVTVGILAYRFIVNNMPVLYEHPEYKEEH
ncbi:MAG: Integral membrane protein DVU_0534 [Olavius algarvensis Delta 4 endosymbiont]|nr:MAG: Integral membrane protein DVU_0534 [Olavius algarvensis Delta 4 endosymbiont]